MKEKLTAFLLLFSHVMLSQEYQSTNLTMDNGLASDMVYCIEQDDKGYMWFGTDAGVSRFDGFEFRNYYPEDGLPDNEIINFFKDSYGRIWMYTVNGKTGFIDGDSIYTSENYKPLEQLDFDAMINSIVELKDSTVILSGNVTKKFRNDTSELVRLPGESRFQYTTILDDSILYHSGRQLYIGKDDSVKLIYEYNGPLESPLQSFSHYEADGPSLIRARVADSYLLTLNYRSFEIDTIRLATSVVYNINRLNDKLYIYLSDGVYRLHEGSHHMVKHFAVKDPSSGFLDNQGGMWVSTLNGGIYYFKQTPFRTYRKVIEPLTLAADSQNLLVYHERNKISKIGPDATIDLIHTFERDAEVSNIHIHDNGNPSFLRHYKHAFIDGKETDIDFTGHDIDKKEGRYVILGNTSVHIQKPGRNLSTNEYKKIANWDRFTENINVGFRKMQVYSLDSIVIASRVGLLKFHKHEFVNFSAINPLMGSRMTDMDIDKKGRFWLATEGNGVLMFDGESVTQVNKEDGLLSNICSKITLVNDTVWVGSPEGLNRMTMTDAGISIIQITDENGMLASRVNDVEGFRNELFVATSEGLFSFPTNSAFFERNDFPIFFTEMLIDGEGISLADELLVSHRARNIEIKFNAINFSNQNSLKFQYRLTNADEDQAQWVSSSERSQRFTSLKPADYVFELQAKTKNSAWTASQRLEFTVLAPIWQTIWFQLLSVIVMGLITLSVYRVIKRNADLKDKLQRDRISSEIKALKAQINPHFLFNALNSMQRFVIEKKIDLIGIYLLDYGKLIRKVLDHSDKLLVTLTEEIETLKLYIEMEQLRTDNRFQASFIIDSEIDEYTLEIPSMIIQPFIENSIWHGVMPLEKPGEIEIRVMKKNNQVIIMVRDNGVGFEKNNDTKSDKQSKGLKLVKDRLSLLEKYYQQEFKTEIFSTPGKGTDVNIYFPANLLS